MGRKKRNTDPLLGLEDQENGPAAEAENTAPTEQVAAEAKPAVIKTPAKAEPAKKVTIQDVLDEGQRTKKMLDAGPQTQFIIPLAEGEKPGAYETVEINGYKKTIKKGCLVTIPVPMAEVLANHYQIQMTAGSDKLIDRDEKVRNALSK